MLLSVKNFRALCNQARTARLHGQDSRILRLLPMMDGGGRRGNSRWRHDIPVSHRPRRAYRHTPAISSPRPLPPDGQSAQTPRAIARPRGKEGTIDAPPPNRRRMDIRETGSNARPCVRDGVHAATRAPLANVPAAQPGKLPCDCVAWMPLETPHNAFEIFDGARSRAQKVRASADADAGERYCTPKGDGHRTASLRQPPKAAWRRLARVLDSPCQMRRVELRAGSWSCSRDNAGGQDGRSRIAADRRRLGSGRGKEQEGAG